MEWLIPALALPVLVLMTAVHRRLSALRREIDPAWVELDHALRKRHGLVTSLLEAVRRHAPKETKLLDGAAQARAKATLADLAPEAHAKAEQALTVALDRVIGLAEARPALQEDPRFKRMTDSLAKANEAIELAIEAFNGRVLAYADAKRHGLALVMAKYFLFRDVEFFVADKAAREAAQAGLGPTFWTRA